MRIAGLFLLCGFFLSFTAAAPAQELGVVSGRIIDLETGAPLPGANVVVQNPRLGTVSDRGGLFRIAGVPAGERVLVVSYIGYETKTQVLEVKTGGVANTSIALAVRAFEMETLVVTGIMQGQMLALNQQKTADHIKNVVASDLIGRFPDPNTAEAIQRIPGVSVARDQGEGRYVLVRGTEARLTPVMINGDQLPAPEGSTRAVALDVIPSDQIASIELNKALTPDMDADGIGGSVNLITRRALSGNRTAKLTLASGYNNLMSDGIFQGAVTFGERVGDGRLGYLFSASHYQTDRGSDNNEFAWGDEDFGSGDQVVLGEMELRDYVVTRKRTGASGTIDYQFDAQSSFFVRGIYNRFSDQEHRRRVRLRFDRGSFATPTTTTDSRVLRELKNRYEEQEIYSLTIGGTQALSGLTLDYSAGYSYADEDEPGAQYMTFEQRGVDFAYDLADRGFPVYTVTNGVNILDPANYAFSEFSDEDNRTTDKNWTAKTSLKMPFRWNGGHGAFRMGGSVRAKDKDRTNNVRIYDGYQGSLRLSDVAGAFEDTGFLGSRYAVGKMPDPKKTGDFFAAHASQFEFDADGSRADTDPSNYKASENVYGGFAETRMDFGKMVVLAGVRYERTDLTYTGNEIIFDADGDYETTRPVSGNHEYGHLFPMAHLRYALDANTNLRLALTRSMARPNYEDLVPYQVVNREDEELERGNSLLKPTLSANVDVMVERYLASVGVLSGGFFYKKLNDYIYTHTFKESGGAFDGYEVEQPVNGGDATLWGFEAAWQQQFSTLPGWLSGFGLYANYTYADSEAEVIGRADKPTLPGQAKHMGNVAVSYEKRGFSGRLALNVHGTYMDEVGDDPADDIYFDRHSQLDLSLSQQIRPNARVFLEVLNLTNEPLRAYQGSRDRPVQQEYYSWWGHMGVKLDF